MREAKGKVYLAIRWSLVLTKLSVNKDYYDSYVLLTKRTGNQNVSVFGSDFLICKMELLVWFTIWFCCNYQGRRSEVRNKSLSYNNRSDIMVGDWQLILCVNLIKPLSSHLVNHYSGCFFETVSGKDWHLNQLSE